MSKARQLADLGNVYDDGALSHRNLIINGACTVAQRSSSVTGIQSYGYHTTDRFLLSILTLGTWTVETSTDAPDGFSNSHKITCTTADASPAAGDYLFIEQRLEGQNLQQLKKGTANALPVTLSFWVKSNKTGTYIAEFDDADNSRNINLSYTVNSSGVWEYKTITFDGDTSGVLDNDAGFSARICWWLAGGSNFTSGTLATSWESTVNANRAVNNVNLADTTSNYFAITGVQLEIGDTATPFEHRSYGDELARCQRYYQVFASRVTNYPLGWGYTWSNGARLAGGVNLPCPLRAEPSWDGLGHAVMVSGDGGVADATAVSAIVYDAGSNTVSIDLNLGSGVSANHAVVILNKNTQGTIKSQGWGFALDAEL